MYILFWCKPKGISVKNKVCEAIIKAKTLKNNATTGRCWNNNKAKRFKGLANQES